MAMQEELRKQGDFLFRHRSYLPLIILMVGLGVYAASEYRGEEAEFENWFSENYGFICLAISSFGAIIRIIVVGHSPENTSGRNTKDGQIAEILNTTGLYSLIRHPLYFGNFFMWLGVAMLTENFWFVIAFAFMFGLYYERIMYAEESFLREKFGQYYLNWSRNVPAFVPSFKNYRAYKRGSFRFKKVLKKEKNGIAAIFFIFWLFEIVGKTMENQAFSIEFDFWFFAASISIFTYFILKVLKKRKLLD